MGSKLAPIMAEFAMHFIEAKLQMPKFYIRYVDDCLAVFNDERQADEFLQNLNSISPEIQFTMEKFKDKTINFLDMTISLNGDSLQTKWHMKPTITPVFTFQIFLTVQIFTKLTQFLISTNVLRNSQTIPLINSITLKL